MRFRYHVGSGWRLSDRDVAPPADALSWDETAAAAFAASPEARAATVEHVREVVRLRIEMLEKERQKEKECAETEKRRLEVEKQRTELEKQRTESERQRTESERQRAMAEEAAARHLDAKRRLMETEFELSRKRDLTAATEPDTTLVAQQQQQQQQQPHPSKRTRQDDAAKEAPPETTTSSSSPQTDSAAAATIGDVVETPETNVVGAGGGDADAAPVVATAVIGGAPPTTAAAAATVASAAAAAAAQMEARLNATTRLLAATQPGVTKLLKAPASGHGENVSRAVWRRLVATDHAGSLPADPVHPLRRPIEVFDTLVALAEGGTVPGVPKLNQRGLKSLRCTAINVYNPDARASVAVKVLRCDAWSAPIVVTALAAALRARWHHHAPAHAAAPVHPSAVAGKPAGASSTSNTPPATVAAAPIAPTAALRPPPAASEAAAMAPISPEPSTTPPHMAPAPAAPELAAAVAAVVAAVAVTAVAAAATMAPTITAPPPRSAGPELAIAAPEDTPSSHETRVDEAAAPTVAPRAAGSLPHGYLYDGTWHTTPDAALHVHGQSVFDALVAVFVGAQFASALDLLHRRQAPDDSGGVLEDAADRLNPPNLHRVLELHAAMVRRSRPAALVDCVYVHVNNSAAPFRLWRFQRDPVHMMRVTSEWLLDAILYVTGSVHPGLCLVRAIQPPPHAAAAAAAAAAHCGALTLHALVCGPAIRLTVRGLFRPPPPPPPHPSPPSSQKAPPKHRIAAVKRYPYAGDAELEGRGFVQVCRCALVSGERWAWICSDAPYGSSSVHPVMLVRADGATGAADGPLLPPGVYNLPATERELAALVRTLLECAVVVGTAAARTTVPATTGYEYLRVETDAPSLPVLSTADLAALRRSREPHVAFALRANAAYYCNAAATGTFDALRAAIDGDGDDAGLARVSLSEQEMDARVATLHALALERVAVEED